MVAKYRTDAAVVYTVFLTFLGNTPLLAQSSPNGANLDFFFDDATATTDTCHTFKPNERKCWVNSGALAVISDELRDADFYAEFNWFMEWFVLQTNKPRLL